MVGLRWKKCDFHLHTMESKCYTADDTPEKWIDTVVENDLQCIAVTDHNSYKGIDSIVELGRSRGITVFPGVEVTCDSSKVHILCIFDTNCMGDKVRDFLSRIRIDSNLIGKSEGCTDQSIFNVCKEAKEYGALVIAAHIDEFNGISELSAVAQNKILSREYIDAVQVVNSLAWENYKKDKNKEALFDILKTNYGKEISEAQVEQWRKTYERAQQANIPMIASSDNPSAPSEARHGLWGIGNRYTWIKMEDEPTLEGIRQAFLSSDTRVVMDSTYDRIPENDPEYWIKSVSLNKSNINPYAPVKAEFNPQLNSIIGGRGSGKSTIIRLLTGALRSLDAEEVNEIKLEQNNFYKKTKKGEGIFEDSSSIEIELHRAGIEYKLIANEIVSMEKQNISLKRLDGEHWVDADINYLDFFKAQVFTQKQIFEIAKTPNALMKIIDSDISEVPMLKEKINDSYRGLLNIREEVRNKTSIIESESKLASELNDIQERINYYKQSGISDLLEKKQQDASEKTYLQNYIAESELTIQALEKAAQTVELSDIDNNRISDQEVITALQNHRNKIETLINTIFEQCNEIKQETDTLTENIRQSAWNHSVNQTETLYKQKCEELKEKGIDAGKLDALLNEREEKKKELASIEDTKKKLNELIPKSDMAQKEYLSTLNELRNKRTEFLRNILGNASDIEIEVIPYGDEKSFSESIFNILQKRTSSIDEDVNKIIKEIDFSGKNIDKKIKTFRNKMQSIREGKNSTLSGYFNREIKSLSDESFDKLITFWPEDKLKVSYRSERNGKLIPLSSASAGQKTTAILTFALAYGDVPLILDQPEDDLDNKLVYDLVVRRLKEAKKKRQIIVVTHNANIPVNGDSEYVIAMNSESQYVKVKGTGTIDNSDIRQEICDVMEGTKYAFKKRAEKYHLDIAD